MNQALTLVKENPSKNGYEFMDDKGQSWWIPPSDKKSGASNEPLAVEIRANLGKPLDLATWIKDDGTTHAIFGKAAVPKSGGGGYKGMTSEERVAERRSIEAQKAAGIAVAILGSVPDHSFNPTRARDWVCESIGPIAQAIRQTAESSARPTTRTGEGGSGVEPSEPAKGGDGDRAFVPDSSPAGEDENYPLERLKALIAKAGYSPEDLPELIGVSDPAELGAIQLQKYGDLIEKKLAKKGAA